MKSLATRSLMTSGAQTAMGSLSTAAESVPLWKPGLAALFTAAEAFWLIRVLPDYWNGRGIVTRFYRYDPVPAVWPWGRILWHAFARTTPYAVTVGLLIAPLILIEYLAPRALTDSSPYIAFEIAYAVALLLGWPMVALTNRPRKVIPPRYRGKPGMLVEIWTEHVGHRLQRSRSTDRGPT